MAQEEYAPQHKRSQEDDQAREKPTSSLPPLIEGSHHPCGQRKTQEKTNTHRRRLRRKKAAESDKLREMVAMRYIENFQESSIQEHGQSTTPLSQEHSREHH